MKYRLGSIALLGALLGLLSARAVAADLLVDQKDKQFSKKALKIKVGDVIEFRNSDPFAHNIFSLSPTPSPSTWVPTRKVNPKKSPLTSRARSRWSAPSTPACR